MAFLVLYRHYLISWNPTVASRRFGIGEGSVGEGEGGGTQDASAGPIVCALMFELRCSEDAGQGAQQTPRSIKGRQPTGARYRPLARRSILLGPLLPVARRSL